MQLIYLIFFRLSFIYVFLNNSPSSVLLEKSFSCTNIYIYIYIYPHQTVKLVIPAGMDNCYIYVYIQVCVSPSMYLMMTSYPRLAAHSPITAPLVSGAFNGGPPNLNPAFTWPSHFAVYTAHNKWPNVPLLVSLHQPRRTLRPDLWTTLTRPLARGSRSLIYSEKRRRLFA